MNSLIEKSVATAPTASLPTDMPATDASAVARDHAALPASVQVATLLVGAVAATIVFIANYNWIIWLFYLEGAYLYDAGVIASLIWHNEPFHLRLPEILGGISAQGDHFRPIFEIINLISHIVPLGRVEYFAVFEGTIYAAIALAIYAYLASNARTMSAVVFAGLVALVFCFSGYIMRIVSYPHYEMLWVAPAFCFFWMLFRQKYLYATLFFLLALSVREDGGFHLFGFLFLVIVADLLRGRPLRSQAVALTFAAVAFFYTVSANLIQTHLLHGGGEFALWYLGNPPYGYLSISYFIHRVVEFMTTEQGIVASFLAVTIFAVWHRRPAYLLGFLACGPWILLHLVAPEYTWLHSYRQFPLVLAIAWPALEIGRQYQFKPPPRAWWWCGTTLVVVSLASWSGANSTQAVGFLGYKPQRTSFNALIRLLESPTLHEHYGRIVVVDSVAALSNRNLRHSEVTETMGTLDTRIDMFIYFQDSQLERGKVRYIVANQHFTYGYRLKGTNVLIASREPLTSDLFLGPFVEKDSHANKFFPYIFNAGKDTYVRGDEMVAPLRSSWNVVIFGPYLALQPGIYDADFSVSPSDPHGTGQIKVEVTTNAGNTVLASRSLAVGDAALAHPIRLRFELNEKNMGAVEFRIWTKDTGLVVKNIAFRRVNGGN